MFKKCAFSILVVAVLAAQAPPSTTLSDTVYSPISGTVFSGVLDVSSPFVGYTSDGSTIGKWTKRYNVTNGVISIPFVPNDVIVTPTNTYYVLTFTPSVSASGGPGWVTNCVIPSSPSVVKQGTVVNGNRVCSVNVPPAQGGSPSGSVMAGQLATGGTIGQVLVRDPSQPTGQHWVTLSMLAQLLALGGTDGQALVRDPSQPSGLRWATISAGPSTVIWSALTGSQWASLTNTQWSSLTQ
jgi:hypothetical protein